MRQYIAAFHSFGFGESGDVKTVVYMSNHRAGSLDNMGDAYKAIAKKWGYYAGEHAEIDKRSIARYDD